MCKMTGLPDDEMLTDFSLYGVMYRLKYRFKGIMLTKSKSNFDKFLNLLLEKYEIHLNTSLRNDEITPSVFRECAFIKKLFY